jgi:hypothetical protein
MKRKRVRLAFGPLSFSVAERMSKRQRQTASWCIGAAQVADQNLPGTRTSNEESAVRAGRAAASGGVGSHSAGLQVDFFTRFL